MDEKARILVVDDEKGMCEFLHYLLEGEGYQVAQAHSGIEALEKIQQERGNLGIAFFINSRVCLSKRLKGVPAHPNGIIRLHQAWLDE